jgi:hypothetical protein
MILPMADIVGLFGVLKQQRGMLQFRRRGLIAVGTEWRWRRPPTISLASTRGNINTILCHPRPPIMLD